MTLRAITRWTGLVLGAGWYWGFAPSAMRCAFTNIEGEISHD